MACPPKLASRSPRAKEGGEGRTRTFEAARATDLQSAAFDRFATSPAVCVWKRVRSDVTLYADGAGEGICTPDLLITNQLLYRLSYASQTKTQTIARPVPPWQGFALLIALTS